MSKPCVLIVDDNPDLRNLYAYALFANFEVHVAQNGAEAILEALDCKPDVIVTDVHMPVLDGIELLQTLKQNDYLATIPVVVLSAASPEYLVEAKLAGAAKVMKTPIDPAKLTELLLPFLPQVISQSYRA